ncbi:hypothetical protein AMTRI_Chr05g68380 [Amborella trichopoda]|uniref:K Homology domain-containing protein n=1 Tax=Amborella trichopoda TaxID=13333 RepID=U5CZP6_AMBTC|nr:far upstream element-binding protein 1 [Amborella trichopoda]ERN15465.1 hypothetical protein AMTR_s00036p00235910 [Amborella trichopoda]|eukprot:XP_006853998.1 far upstream element-binding protein 1 [Amborella trichopoda]
MAEELQFSSRSENKRKFEDPTTAGPRRPTGFSSPPPDSGEKPAYDLSNSNGGGVVPEEIEIAKQKAQEIVARLVGNADAKRVRVDDGTEKGADGYRPSVDLGQKLPGSHMINSQGNALPPSTYPGAYGFQGTSKKIEIPNGRVGVIIGKSGDTIKYLQLQSGAKIQVTRDMDADPTSQTRPVELLGTPEQISKAEQLINDVLAEAEAGGSGILARRFGTAHSGSEQFVLKVPNNKVGLIIGKGGETIKNMQSQSGARIQLIPLHLPPGDASTDRTVQIDGTKEQIEMAKQLVNDIVSENRLRNPPMSGGYIQQGYRPPRPPANWGPPGPPPTQQPGYGYPQTGAYPTPPPAPQFNSTLPQPPYSGYPQQASSGWDQPPPAPSQPTPQGTSYDYYGQQQQAPPPQGTQQSSMDNTNSTSTTTYGYNQQPPPANYTQQGSYGEPSYPNQPVAQGYGQQSYGGSYQAPSTTTQPSYGQQPTNPQQGYTQSYSAPPPYEAGPTPPSSYGPQNPSSQQASGPVGYNQAGPTGYGAPPSSQPYVNPPPQAGYGQAGPTSVPPTNYGQKPPVQPLYTGQPASTTQTGSIQPGYNPQVGSTQPGYGGPPPSAPSYGQQSYGAPVASQPAPYGAPPTYNDQYGAYSQPPVYGSDAAPAAQAPPVQAGVVPKASPQS